MTSFTRRSILIGAAASAAVPGIASAATPADSGLTFASRTPMRIGQVSLRVRDVERMTDYYRRLLALRVVDRNGDTVRLGAGGVPLLSLVGDPKASRPLPGSAGLYHTAFLMPTRADLAHWIVHVIRNGIEVSGASDHAVSEAFYLDDPEGNGIEIYSDRPPESWAWDSGTVQMGTKQLDVDAIVSLIDMKTSMYRTAPDALRIGHVHLRVGNLSMANAFYCDMIGFDPVRQRQGASFISSGRYHHHVGMNTWESAGAGKRDPGAAGLDWLSIEVERSRFGAMEGRLREGGADVSVTEGGLETVDPWGTRVRLIAV